MPNAKVALIVVLAWVWGPACGEPRVPGDDAVVLERVPAAQATRRLDPLRKQVSADPNDLSSALQLAQGYLVIGRETSDPRFVSYAHATLSPWLRQPNPSAPVLVLAATALQSSHRFDEALELLERAIALDSRNGQAWLTKATLLQVKGDFPAAGAACKRLLHTADQLIALTCLASVDSLSGRLEGSYRRLRDVSATAGRGDEELQSWVSGQLAEMSVRRGDFVSAERYFLTALRASPEDAWLKGAYADLLLLMDRNKEVIDLLKGDEAQDILLLRLAIAGERLDSSSATRWAELFDARRRAARRGDSSHLREYARFLLEVRNAPAEALRVAEDNWGVQREPPDVRVYLQSALRAGKQREAAIVQSWILETGYEDRTLADLMGPPVSQP